MPHVVLEGPVDLGRYAERFEPIELRVDRDVLRAERVFVEREGRALLIEALVVEAGRKQAFYVIVSQHGGTGASVRIDPVTHPELSPAVRDLVARLGADLLARSPGARIGVTNLVIPSDPAGGQGLRSGKEEGQ